MTLNKYTLQYINNVLFTLFYFLEQDLLSVWVFTVLINILVTLMLY